MPLSINVGLSRKASKDYQSTGYSINVTAELDQSLLARPDELQQQIDALYQQAGNALDRQVKQHPAQSQPQQRQQYRRPYYNRSNGGNGNGNGNNGNGNGNRGGYANTGAQTAPSTEPANNGSRNNGGLMTESQRKAIYAISKRLNIDAAQECHDVFGLELDHLTLKQASEMIDHLKAQTNEQPAR